MSDPQLSDFGPYLDYKAEKVEDWALGSCPTRRLVHSIVLTHIRQDNPHKNMVWGKWMVQKEEK